MEGIDNNYTNITLIRHCDVFDKSTYTHTVRLSCWKCHEYGITYCIKKDEIGRTYHSWGKMYTNFMLGNPTSDTKA